MPQPPHLEDGDHPEAERDLVLELRPRTSKTVTVRFRHVGRPTPRLVLDHVIADDK